MRVCVLACVHVRPRQVPTHTHTGAISACVHHTSRFNSSQRHRTKGRPPFDASRSGSQPLRTSDLPSRGDRHAAHDPAALLPRFLNHCSQKVCSKEDSRPGPTRPPWSPSTTPSGEESPAAPLAARVCLPSLKHQQKKLRNNDYDNKTHGTTKPAISK